jgi:hypothetical protein
VSDERDWEGEISDGIAMGELDPDGSQREPDEPDWGMREEPAPRPTCAAYGAAHDAPVWRPGDPGHAGRFCYECIDRCHEALEFDHVCAVCR